MHGWGPVLLLTNGVAMSKILTHCTRFILCRIGDIYLVQSTVFEREEIN